MIGDVKYNLKLKEEIITGKESDLTYYVHVQNAFKKMWSSFNFLNGERHYSDDVFVYNNGESVSMKNLLLNQRYYNIAIEEIFHSTFTQYYSINDAIMEFNKKLEFVDCYFSIDN